ncbi:MAG: hypothetical protein ABSG70_05505 [Terriglobales bacterium]
MIFLYTKAAVIQEPDKLGDHLTLRNEKKLIADVSDHAAFETRKSLEFGKHVSR